MAPAGVSTRSGLKWTRVSSAPLRKGDQDLHALLMIGVYQIRYTDIPDHAAVSETVGAASALRKPWARPLANAVLRRIARTRPAHSTDEAKYDHPQWLIDALRTAHPNACPGLFEINNSRAPMALRVNRGKTDPRRYRSRLDAAALAHRPGIAPGSVILERPVPASELPGFDDGLVAVQDDGAQLAAGLLDPRPGSAVLDACAAPGGKAFHLLEREPTLHMTALDRDEARLAYLKRDARRLGHSLDRVVAGDATGTAWWDGKPFDAILLDVSMFRHRHAAAPSRYQGQPPFGCPRRNRRAAARPARRRMADAFLRRHAALLYVFRTARRESGRGRSVFAGNPGRESPCDPRGLGP